MSWITASYVNYPEYKRIVSLPKGQVDAMVARLNVKKTLTGEEKAMHSTVKHLSQREIDEMLERLADTERNRGKTPERQRTGSAQVMGIVNTYAWMNARVVKSRITRADGNWY